MYRHVLVESKVSVTSLSSLLQPAARLTQALEGRTHRHVRGSVSTPPKHEIVRETRCRSGRSGASGP